MKFKLFIATSLYHWHRSKITILSRLENVPCVNLTRRSRGSSRTGCCSHGRVSMLTRPDPRELQAPLEITARESHLLLVLWDSRELTHLQKARPRGLSAGLGPVTVHASRWGVGCVFRSAPRPHCSLLFTRAWLLPSAAVAYSVVAAAVCMSRRSKSTSTSTFGGRPGSRMSGRRASGWSPRCVPCFHEWNKSVLAFRNPRDVSAHRKR